MSLAKYAASSPALRPKSLMQRQNRSGRILASVRATEPSRLALALRKRIHELFDASDIDYEGADPELMIRSAEIRIEAARAVCPLIDKFLDVIQYPKRPPSSATQASSRQLLDMVSAMPTDVDLAPPAPSEPASDPTKV